MNLTIRMEGRQGWVVELNIERYFHQIRNSEEQQRRVESGEHDRTGAPIQNQLTEISLNYLRGLNPVVMDYQLI